MQTDILIFTTGQGHSSSSQALIDEIKDRTSYSVKVIKYDQEVLIHKLLHRFAPILMRLLSKPIYSPGFTPFARIISAFRFTDMVEGYVKRMKPKVIISTFYLLNSSIEKIKQKYGFYFINLLTDPRTMIYLNPSPMADMNFTFDEYQSSKILEIYPKAKTKAVGWFVQSIFEKDYDQEKVRKSLGLKSNVPVFLFTSGSLGNAGPTKFLPNFLKSKNPVQIIMICGSNKLLKNIADGFKDSFGKNKNVDFKVVGFTKEMYKYMRAADLVIGKSGPNTIFESVATLTPFMAINYGGSQELGNQEIIKEYKIGIVEIRLKKIWKIITGILDNPEILDGYKDSVKKLRDYNRNSKKFLIDEINKVMMK